MRTCKQQLYNYLQMSLHHTMQSNHAGFISRSSSIALSMAQDPVPMTVAQELLSRPNHVRQRSTFTTRSSRSYYQFDGSDNQQQVAQLSADAYPVGRSRRAGYTSNTWTSSSGDVLSDQDEIDDRTFFVLEYNRLARKVLSSFPNLSHLLTLTSAWRAIDCAGRA
jgi:hypothetical protein